MVKLNSTLAVRKGTKYRASSSETEKHFLKKQTHLYLQNKLITEIEDLSTCTNLTVLYLQGNLLEQIDNLYQAANLTNLYLQDNKIKNIENIGNLKKLKKLYLGRNSISQVNGIDELTSLEELHVEKQNTGHELKFDSKSLTAIKHSLRVLVVSQNRLRNISPLLCLENLEQLRASNNQLTEVSEVASALQGSWPHLRELSLQGNPVCSKLHYRERIIAASYHTLGVLDGKQILPVTRSFLQSLALRQASHRIQPCSAKRSSMHDVHGQSRNPSLQLAINSQHCARLPDLPTEDDHDPLIASHFPAWKSAGKRRSSKMTMTPDHMTAKNWAPLSAVGRRKSCSSTSTDLSQHLHISRL